MHYRNISAVDFKDDDLSDSDIFLLVVGEEQKVPSLQPNHVNNNFK